MTKIEWTLASPTLPMPELDYPQLEQWLTQVAASHNRIIGPIVYRFCDDPEILSVNRQYLNHDYYTDIITFDYSRSRMLSGDMVISLDTVASNALTLGTDPHRELMRVIVHGLLHLCGIDDKAPGQRQIMEQHENTALALWDQLTTRK